jgi:SNF2 family DNA or RNA helicase
VVEVTFLGELRPFQKDAMVTMVDTGVALLAFHMGLGKTVITIAAIEDLIEGDGLERALVVVPAGLKFQWRDQLTEFSDSRKIVIDGSADQRAALWRAAHRCKYVIANPEMLLTDRYYVKRLPYDCVVLDEATCVKNPRARRSKVMRAVGARAPYRFALTGQPIENRPEELFAIMEFVDGEVLGSPERFDRTFIVRSKGGKALRYRNLPRLHEALDGVMLRKTFDDVRDQMPSVTRTTVPVKFDAKGAGLYRFIASDLRQKISMAMQQFGRGFDLNVHYGKAEDTEANKVRGEIMSRLLCLRMLCDDPALLVWSARRSLADDEGGSAYAAELSAAGLLAGVVATPKLDLVCDRIEEILAESPRNKIVVFSFFLRNLESLRQRLPMYRPAMFIGTMSNKQRDAERHRFLDDPKCRVFLSSDAGGYGVDLPNANYLISVDLPWSGGKMAQREARIIRLSSEFKGVFLMEFLMSGSIEEFYAKALMQKLDINKAFVDRKTDVHGGFELTLGTLTEFLDRSDVR